MYLNHASGYVQQSTLAMNMAYEKVIILILQLTSAMNMAGMSIILCLYSVLTYNNYRQVAVLLQLTLAMNKTCISITLYLCSVLTLQSLLAGDHHMTIGQGNE